MKLVPARTLKEIAELINATIYGDPEMMVEGINEIHKVQTGDLTFVDHPKYIDKALMSDASVILTNGGKQITNGKALLRSDDPLRDYNILVDHFNPFRPASKSISDDVEIGKGTIIQPNVFLGHGVKIGKNCIIHPNVTIYDNTTIGNNVIIHANTIAGSDAFYYQNRSGVYKKMESCGRVIIEDDVEIGSGCAIDRGVSGETTIGQGTKMDNQVHVGHGTSIGKNCLFAAQVGIGGKVTIKDNVILWGQVGISKDLIIGEKVIVLAQSGVVKSLSAGKVYFGSPVQDARAKMKELAILKNLDEIWNSIKRS
ncbi:MAG: UDP-3-O-(3-hydroxymyristoyl)glucosamine N-acyltransferase [Bacteroidetes bacterium]|nr:UDP-3-O-(3-hydroxymyristoyl)glucosamine N-acyltransferase [Bacteroidota bacterium]